MSTHLLSIGLNYQGEYRLNGCHNDVDTYKKTLYDTSIKKGIFSSMKDDEKPTKERIRMAIEDIYKECKPGDLVIFTFSGHGGQVQDLDGDEKDSLDECIFDCDIKPVIDDDLNLWLVQKLPEKVRLRVILDCCHSGTGIDLPWELKPYNSKENVSNKITSKDVVCISGCKDRQTSADAWIDRKPQGALTSCLCSILSTKSKDMRWKDLINVLQHKIKEGGYDQDPVMSFSNLSISYGKVDI